MEELIRSAVDYAREVFRDDSSGHDLDHTLRVFRTAVMLAEQEGADRELVSLIALLHDVDDVKLFPESSSELEHAVSFLQSRSVDKDHMEKICTAIRQISFAGKDSVVPDTLEGRCVQDADRLDALGAVGIARAFAYGGAHHRKMHDPEISPRLELNGEEYRQYGGSTTINHFHEKLLLLESMMNTPAARRIAAKRTAYMRGFLEEFRTEWDGKD